jgi:Xaa-Pro dipeptidase
MAGDFELSPDVPAQVTPREELEARARRLQGLVREARLDGVMATQNADVFYLSGVVQQAQVYLPAEGDPLLMVRKHHGRARMMSRLPEESVVAVRSLRELPALIEKVSGRKSQVASRKVLSTSADLRTETSRPETLKIGFELDTLPVAIFNAYAKALDGLGAELIDASMLFRQARAVKSDFEIEQVRRAAAVADAGVRAAAERLREGITEVELAAWVEYATRVAGHSGAVRIRVYGQEMHMGHLLAGDAGSLPSFMNSPTGGHGPGPWAPYGAGRRPIRKGEPVLLDYSGEWGGYLADQTRMLSVGPLSIFWQDAYAAMLDVQSHVERTIRPGMSSGELYDIAVERATALGYGDNFMGPPEEESPGQKVPFVGHAVGLELDEWPPLQRGTDAVLESGMVLAFEPKLVYWGQGAIGIEDTYLLTNDGLSSLTFSTREIIEV